MERAFKYLFNRASKLTYSKIDSILHFDDNVYTQTWKYLNYVN